ncbi:hypothetical protein TRFO_21877 [Tritrichomonas foetus]|uniref:Protein kinase domain-containing protein n=1 Tax=Tritrichomonas foetus TaxID=1144522 RepID=A0A1J4KD05_9EUKA|nr:hypothetical protein TRFO_21877 [Tritrichomonas foetus]|eukprot:OHT09305.1 hypothetical protein TRFO_21877 [Tritrichomonas foetus]
MIKSAFPRTRCRTGTHIYIVIIRIFNSAYNLASSTIDRICKIHNILNHQGNGKMYFQTLETYQNKETNIQLLIFEYYPKTDFKKMMEENFDEYYLKAVPSFIIEGLNCLQQLKNKQVCHHDICLENIHFQYDWKEEKADFKLLNFTFATCLDLEIPNTNEKYSHKVSIETRHNYMQAGDNDQDYYLYDLWDFGIAAFSIINFDENDQKSLIKELSQNPKTIQWIPMFKNLHQKYQDLCFIINKLFALIFNGRESIEYVISEFTNFLVDHKDIKCANYFSNLLYQKCVSVI